MTVPPTASPIVPPAAVAVIGLGNMGVPMGACLIKAGFAVTGFDLSEAARANFAAAGGRCATDAAEAVASADVVITLLPNGKIVRQAVEGFLPNLKPGAIVVDMSSSDPIGTRQLGEDAGRRRLSVRRCAGVRRRQASGERDTCHHGGGRTPPPSTARKAACRHGHVDLPHRRARLRPRHEGAQQLRLFGRARRGGRGAADRAQVRARSHADDGYPQRLVGQEQHHRSEAQAVHHFGNVCRRLSAAADGQGCAHRRRHGPRARHSDAARRPVRAIVGSRRREAWTRRRITPKCCAIWRGSAGEANRTPCRPAPFAGVAEACLDRGRSVSRAAIGPRRFDQMSRACEPWRQ